MGYVGQRKGLRMRRPTGYSPKTSKIECFFKNMMHSPLMALFLAEKQFFILLCSEIDHRKLPPNANQRLYLLQFPACWNTYIIAVTSGLIKFCKAVWSTLIAQTYAEEVENPSEKKISKEKNICQQATKTPHLLSYS